MSTATSHRITSLEQLREIIPAPDPTALAVLKEKDALDEHCRAVIAASPFMLLATAGNDGRCDVSPRGDGAGFVHVLDDRTIVIPDRPGNQRIDSLQNIIENPYAATIFLVPTMDETLRVNGRAWITTEPKLLARMKVGSKQPRVGIVIETEEVYFQCARAFKRSKLWQPETWPDRSELPSFAQILYDQIRPEGYTVEQLEERNAEGNRRLYSYRGEPDEPPE
jgi:PPOX class probable FMN-dependent enzyme